MSDIPIIGQKPKVAILHPKNNAIGVTDGSHWKSALDMLKELVNDLEHGRISAPEYIYVAMQTRHSINRDMVAHPSYCWGSTPNSGLNMIGLLAKHENKLLNPGR
jgi:hypothetical protein